MDDNNAVETSTESTEVKADTEKVGLSLRETLAARFDADDEAKAVAPKNVEEAAKIEKVQQDPQTPEATTGTSPQERVAIAPPADMRKEEREAFLNPTAENAHILQGYLSRRREQQRENDLVKRLKSQIEERYRNGR